MPEPTHPPGRPNAGAMGIPVSTELERPLISLAAEMRNESGAAAVLTHCFMFGGHRGAQADATAE